MKFLSFIGFSVVALLMLSLFTNCNADSKNRLSKFFSTDSGKKKMDSVKVYPPIDTALYDSLMLKLANGDKSGQWPVKKQPYPLPGAILPFNRIVVYYGSSLSKKMGALGADEPKEMWRKLNIEANVWRKADTTTPVKIGLHYIASVASDKPESNGKYIKRMSAQRIDSVLKVAKMQPNTLVFLDLQVAQSTLKEELPYIEKYLKMPEVHLGIDPEFSMKNGAIPGKRVGTFDATEINEVTAYLADLVKKYKLPPKVFILHRFTKNMVTNSRKIKLRPEVQVVIDIDGWGTPNLKKLTYQAYAYNHPVQFTGIKLFYRNDLKTEPKRMLTPEELLKMKPKPIYIQYH